MDQAQSATNKATGQIEKGLGKVDSALKKVAKAAAAYISVKALVSFSKSCVELGSDLAEVQNVVDVTFGSMAGQIDKFAKSAIKQFGLSETAAKQYSSTMGAMLKSMGLTTEQAYTMSTSLSGLAGDLASFYNLSTDEAFAKIRSGISGETEPLKQLGINLSVANLEAYALSQGITKSYNAMTQAEQAVLRYNYLLSVTSDAQGDFARTSGSWANQVKVLRMQFDSLKATLGQGMIMALTPVVRVLNKLMERLQKLAEKFRVVMAIITGQDIGGAVSDSMAGTAEATATVAEDMTGVSDSAQATAGSVDNITDSMKDANKEVKRFLLSFDEIHKLQSNEDKLELTTSSGVGDDLGNMPTVDEMISQNAIDGVQNAEDSIDGLNNGIGMSQEEIDRLREKLAPVIEFIGTVKDKIGELGAKVGEWWDENAPKFLEAWNSDIKPTLEHWGEKLDELWREHLWPLIQGAGELITALWDNILKPFVQWFANAGFDKIVNTLEDVSDLAGGLLQGGAGLVNGVASGWNFLIGNEEKGYELGMKSQQQMEEGYKKMLSGAGGIGWGITDSVANVVYPWYAGESWQEAMQRAYGVDNARDVFKQGLQTYGNAGGSYGSQYAGVASGYGYAPLDYNQFSQAVTDGINNAEQQDLTINMDGEQVGAIVTNSMNFRNARLNPNGNSWIVR